MHYAKNWEPTDHDMAWVAATHIAMGNKAKAKDAARRALAIEPTTKVSVNTALESYQNESMRDLFQQRIIEAGIPVA